MWVYNLRKTGVAHTHTHTHTHIYIYIYLYYILRRNCLLQRVIKEKIKGEIEVTGRRGIRRRKLLDDLKERRGYSHLKEKALDRTV
jgi:hypothetical protein